MHTCGIRQVRMNNEWSAEATLAYTSSVCIYGRGNKRKGVLITGMLECAKSVWRARIPTHAHMERVHFRPRTFPHKNLFTGVHRRRLGACDMHKHTHIGTHKIWYLRTHTVRDTQPYLKRRAFCASIFDFNIRTVLAFVNDGLQFVLLWQSMTCTVLDMSIWSRRLPGDPRQASGVRTAFIKLWTSSSLQPAHNFEYACTRSEHWTVMRRQQQSTQQRPTSQPRVERTRHGLRVVWAEVRRRVPPHSTCRGHCPSIRNQRWAGKGHVRHLLSGKVRFVQNMY